MILGAVVLIGLLAAPATSSPVKGGLQERFEEQRASGIKGDLGRQLQPVEYSQRPQQHYEQRVQVVQASKGQPETFASEQAKLADSDLHQQREELKSDRQQFYEAQTQTRESADSKQDSSRRLATKGEERVEEQAKFEDFPQQVDESPAQPVKGFSKQDFRPDVVRTHQEVKQQQQVREEVAAPVLFPAPAKTSAKVEQVAVSRSEERREEQVQYAAQAPEEQQPRYEPQRQLDRAELQQQQVELTRDYEQRRYDVQTEVRQEAEPVPSQVREEQLDKGGLRAPGAEAEPYAFDYSVEGSSRRESGDQNGVVRGQYTLQNPDGTQRVVDYVADQDGFRAQVRTNEFGTEGHQQQLQQAAVRLAAPALEGKTSQRQDLARVAVVSAAAVKSAEKSRHSVYQEEKSATSSAFKVDSAAAKGAAELRTAVVHEPEAQVQRVAAAVDTIKSAELRSPKAIDARTGPIVTRASGFESATAHHQHQPSVVHAHPVPVAVPVVAVRHQPVVPSVQVVRHQVLTPSRSHHLSGYQHNFRQHHAQPVLVHGGVSRSQLQHDRYRPASHRRDQPSNPHVSFYANHHHYNHDDEQPVGFEYPAELI